MKLIQAITAATTYSGLSCPKCTSHRYRKHGKCLGIQRYRCKQCGRCFKETVNTALHGIHDKQKMLSYIDALTNQLTIRSAAATISISVQTSFSWRHKLLSSLHTGTVQPARTPAGACQINLPHSCKGKRLVASKTQPASRTFLVADAHGTVCLQHLPAQCTALHASMTIRETLAPVSVAAIAPAKLLTRAVRFAGCRLAAHPSLKQQLILRASSTAARLSAWMYKFRGVATKYLQQYWNWYRILSASESQFTYACLAQRQRANYLLLIGL